MIAALEQPRWLRALPYLLGAWIFYVFVWYLQYKFTGADGSVWLFTVLTDWIGLPGHEKALRIGTGVAELTAAILLFVPRAQVVGAAMSFAIITGAIFFHVASPLGIDPYDDGARLFKEAVAVWFAALAILWIRRAEAYALAGSLPFVGGLAQRLMTAIGWR